MKRIALTIAFIAGMLVGQMVVRPLLAYQESTGVWSASEKRQVIQLLEKIEENTRR